MPSDTLTTRLLRACRNALGHPARNALVALLLACVGPAQAAAPATDAWLEAARDVLADPFFQGLPVTVRVPRAAASRSPASLRLTEDGRCELLLQHRANPEETQVLLSQVSPALQPLLRRAVIVHELTHCWRYLEHPDAVESLFRWEHLARVDAAAAAQALVLRQQEEMFADIAALSWVEHRHPRHFRALLTAFFGLRTDARLSQAAHGSLAALERVHRHGMVYGETPFHAADTALALLRPARTWSTARRSAPR